MTDLFKLNGPESWWRRQDWVLTAATLTLSFLGTLVVWAATRPHLQSIGASPNAYLYRHAIMIAIGVGLAIAVARMRYPMLRAYAPLLYLLGVLGLIAVLVVGVQINGIRAWIMLPMGFTLQPAEFAKLAIIIGVAMVLSETMHRVEEPGNREVVLTLVLVAFPVLLIMLQPDLGTTLVIGVMVLALLAVAGVASQWLGGLSAIGLIGAVLVFTVPGVLSDYQKQRLLVFVNPNLDPQGSGYNLAQVRLAIGSGGWFGTGLFHGPQTNGLFVPEQQTDFIYSAVGEELGFFGAAAIILLLALVCWRALRIARNSSDRFGRIAATGVACWIGFQAFENIGMNIGIMPVTGVPLPFISYGGSSMFALWMAVGLLQNIKMKISD